MPTKNTNTNNNIIQILLENKKAKRWKKGSSKSQSAPTSYMKDNQMQTRPLNLVNSFPSSSRLDDQAGRVRFMDAMRDPFSTKSPYSIYDNGSNTFARQGETAGVEVPVSSQLRPDDYFEEPIRQSARQFSNPRRFDINDDITDLSTVGSNSYNSSHISDVSELSRFPFPLRKVRQGSVNSFPGIPLYKSTDESRYDDWVDPTQQDDIPDEISTDNSDKFGISGAQYFQPEQTRFSETIEPAPAFSTPYRPQAEPKTGGETGETELRHRSQKLDRDMEFYEDAINEIDREFRNLDMMHEGSGETAPATRFSETIEPPPAFSTPYRPQAEEVGERIDKLIGKIDSVSSKIGKKQQPEPEQEQPIQEVEKELEDAETERQRILQEKQAQRDAYVALDEELKRKKKIDKKLKTVITNLEDFITNAEREKKTVPKKGQKVGRPKAGEVRETEIIEIPPKLKKGNTLREDIINLIGDEAFAEYKGVRNIGALTDAQGLLDKLKNGSAEVLERIKTIEKDKEESPQKRVPPRTSGNIQTFAKTAGGGGVSSGANSRTKR